MTTTIGQVPSRINLVVQQGADRNFDVVWRDPANTPVPVSSVIAQIRPSASGAVLLDLGTHTTIDPDGHTMHVAIPASVTAALTPIGRALWSFVAVAAGGEHKVLMEGTATIEAAISH